MASLIAPKIAIESLFESSRISIEVLREVMVTPNDSREARQPATRVVCVTLYLARGYRRLSAGPIRKDDGIT